MSALRRLPYRIRPLPDEPFDSWLETMAASHDVAFGDMMAALGLIGPHAIIEDQRYTPLTMSRWLFNLQDEQLERLTFTTGITASDLQATTRSTFAKSVTRYTLKGRMSAQCPTAGTKGRYCPDCLRDGGGRWRLSWTYSFVAVCPRHKRVLLDHCPRCHTAPRGRVHPVNLVPIPGHCHNKPAGDAHTSVRCGADLARPTTVLPASPIMLAAQRAQFATVAQGAGTFGIYHHDPQSAPLIMEDIRVLTRIVIQAIFRGDAIDTADVPSDVLAEVFKDSRDAYRERPHAAAVAAAGASVAFHALQEPDRVLELIGGRVSLNSSFDRHTPQLQRLVARSRGQRLSAISRLRTAALSPATTTQRARKLPAQMWPQWAARLLPPHSDQDLGAAALSTATLIAGSRLSNDVALEQLGSPLKAKSVMIVTRRLVSDDPVTNRLQVIARLAAYLDANTVPVNFERRRRLDYAELLPEGVWKSVAARHNFPPGRESRLRHVRLALYGWLSGNHPLQAPAHFRSTTGADRIAARRLSETLPQNLELDLLEIASSFLHAHKIKEPVRWTPPIDLLDQFATPDQRTRIESWPAQRPATARVITTFTYDELVAHYKSGHSLQELADIAHVGRSIIGRALREAGVELRPAHAPERLDIDDQHLKEQYERKQLTVSDLAAQTGCADSTVARRLRAQDAEMRPPGGASHASQLRLRDRCTDAATPLLRRALVGNDAFRRMERFLIVAHSQTLHEASLELNLAVASLSAQMSRLARDVGGRLIISARRGHPQNLTRLGKQLQREGHQYTRTEGSSVWTR